MHKRHDGRKPDELRPVQIELGAQKNPEGSVLYRCGDTSVLIACSAENSVPPFLEGRGTGWVTAEYAMHPRANPDRRNKRERAGKVDGRSQEIQRLVGRSLRQAVHMDKLGERSLSIDCDVLDADGGTRTASITGGWVALALALDKLRRQGLVRKGVLRPPVAAVSVGLLEGRALLDLPYVEDSQAQVDLNVVANAHGQIIEVQGTAEESPMTRAELDQLVDLALAGIAELGRQQQAALEQAGVDLAWLTGA